jgi:hypothetical protein
MLRIKLPIIHTFFTANSQPCGTNRGMRGMVFIFNEPLKKAFEYVKNVPNNDTCVPKLY